MILPPPTAAGSACASRARCLRAGCCRSKALPLPRGSTLLSRTPRNAGVGPTAPRFWFCPCPPSATLSWSSSSPRPCPPGSSPCHPPASPRRHKPKAPEASQGRTRGLGPSCQAKHQPPSVILPPPPDGGFVLVLKFG